MMPVLVATRATIVRAALAISAMPQLYGCHLICSSMKPTAISSSSNSRSGDTPRKGDSSTGRPRYGGGGSSSNRSSSSK